MKNVCKQWTGLLFILVLGITLAGCGKTKQTEKTETKVWSTYSSVKVLQNQKPTLSYDVMDAKCEIQMMRNETEGTQLIITAAEEIDNYDLVISDLSDGNGNVIGQEAISVYHQKYLTVNSKTDVLNEDIIIGDHVPDMLLPIETAKEYGENTISPGNNQGITIEVTTSVETVPGTYTGTFNLKMDDESLDIPVSVTVWDVALEGKREFQSSFLIYSNALLAGEYEVSDELIERYQEFFLNYKMNTFVIRQENTPEQLAKEAATFYENNNYSSICIPYTLSTNYTYDGDGADRIIEYIKEIVKISSADKPYFEDLYIYPAYFDEVDMYPEKHEEFVNVFKQDGEWEKTLGRALQEVKMTSEYKAFDAALKERVDESILTIPAVIPCTTNNTEWIDELCVTFCPYLSLFDEQSMSQRYQRQAEALTDGELWTYTCVGPTNPYPTFHIDDYNLGTRVTGWMLKKHNINGYLYWAVNLFEPINADTWKNVNPYTTAERAGTCAGDGFLCYPGAYYGSDYPFPCSRLVAFRDTMDDYDMLSLYESLLNEKAITYGIEIDFETYVEDLYNSLFDGAQYYNDDSLVAQAREKLAQRIMALQSDLGLVAASEQNSIKLYATTDTLSIDGADMSGTAVDGGYEYVIENTENASKDVVVSKDELSATYYLNASKALTISGASASSKSKAVVLDDTISAKISSEEKENEGAMARFRPYMQFEVDDLAGTQGIHFTLNLKTSEEVTGQVFFVMSDMTTKQVDSFLADQSIQDVVITYHAEKMTDEILKDVTAIRISFDNTDTDGKLLPDREFSLEDIYVEMR